MYVASQATKMHGLHGRHALLQTTLNKTNTITICHLSNNLDGFLSGKFSVLKFQVSCWQTFNHLLDGTLLVLFGSKYTTRWKKNYTAENSSSIWQIINSLGQIARYQWPLCWDTYLWFYREYRFSAVYFFHTMRSIWNSRVWIFKNAKKLERLFKIAYKLLSCLSGIKALLKPFQHK